MIGFIMGRLFRVKNEPRPEKQMWNVTSLLLRGTYNKKECTALYEVGKGSRLFLSLREKYTKNALCQHLRQKHRETTSRLLREKYK